MRFLTRRVLAVSASAILVSAACGAPVSPAPVTTARPSAPQPARSAGPSALPSQAASGPGDLVVAVASDPVSFTVPGDDPTSQRIVRLLFRGLYRPDAQLAMVPDLASAPPSVGPDGLTWTVHLQPDARWQDGTPVTSADVAFTYALAASQGCRFATSVCAAVHATLNSITTPDSETVVFHLAQPSAAFLADALGTPIFPQTAVQASFARFQQALTTLDPKSVAATNQSIADAMAQSDCLATSPPASCVASTYVAQIQAILDRPGISVPPRNAVTTYGPLTAEAYGLELIGALGDLAAALDAQGTDRLAAAFELLDFQQDPMGSGPYRVASYTPGQQVILDRATATPAETPGAYATPSPAASSALPSAYPTAAAGTGTPRPTPAGSPAPGRTAAARSPGPTVGYSAAPPATATRSLAPTAVPTATPTPAPATSAPAASSASPGPAAGGATGAAPPARVIFRIMPDTEVAAAALERGELQWVPDIPPEDMPPLESDQALQLAQYPTSSVTYLAFNVRKGRLFYDVNLRRAVAECIDLSQAVHDATGSDGVPLRGFILPGSWAYDSSLAAPIYDPAAGKKLIEASGWQLGPDGIYVKGSTRLAATLWVQQGRTQRVGFAGLAAQQLRACGIDVTVQEADLLNGILPRLSYPNDFDLYLGVRQMSLDPNGDAPLFLSSHIPGESNPDDANIAGWHDPVTDRLLQQAAGETDPAGRAALYAQVQQRLADYLPYLFLWAASGHAALSRSVTADGAPLTLDSPLYDWNLSSWTLGGG